MTGADRRLSPNGEICVAPSRAVAADPAARVRIVEAFSALSDEPIFHVSEHRREDSRRLTASIVCVALIYAAIVATLWLRRETTPVVSEEIPVEVVVAPPEPTPPPPPARNKSEPPKPSDKSLEPAYDAPKEGKSETDAGKEATDGKPPPAPEAPDEAPDRAAGAGAEEHAPKPEGSPAPDPQPAPAPPMKIAEDGDVPLPPTARNVEPPAPARPGPAAGKAKLQAFAALPNVEFGGAPKRTPVAGGNGPAGYLNIVVGMIRQHFHKPGGHALPGGPGFGVIVFRLDSDGQMIDSWFVQHSGSPELDRAQYEALAAASPFPKPPYVGRAIEYHYTVD